MRLQRLGRRVGWPSGIILVALASASAGEVADFVGRHCVSCHNADDKAGGLALDDPSLDQTAEHAGVWERVVKKLNTRQMPPPSVKRPDEAEYVRTIASLTQALDVAADERPDPGPTASFRRLTRTEYQNAIRDLLDVEIDAKALLPPDESSGGFDNITVGGLSPMLLERYISASLKIGRLAVGAPLKTPGGETYRLPPDLTQESHVEGLPLGTRGGGVFRHAFPVDGEYEVVVRLARDRNEHVEGLRDEQRLVILLDRARVAEFAVKPPRSERDHETVDSGLKVRFKVSAGTHDLGVTFVKKSSALLETKRQPYQAHYNMHRHPRLSPAVYQVSINGPYRSSGPGDSASRRRIFADSGRGSEDERARTIVSRLARRAYRRTVGDDDLAGPLALYRQVKAQDGFEAGVEAALGALLVSPRFLFRIEGDPPESRPGSLRRLDDFELASRLSFFLWSSIPDDELLSLAERGDLSRPEVLKPQARRLLADPRSRSLVDNFAAQWLHLRNLDSATPDLRLFPDFDENLRAAFRRETALTFEDVVRNDRSVLELIRRDTTYLNERLANHYGVPGVKGDHFRKVRLEPDWGRGGILRQGSVLTVTSYATRTSPVIRGKWILENIVGTPPPPPPANVPALKDNTVDAALSVRERLAEHRRNPACAGCHRLMDPVGFALENYDAVGRRREIEEGRPVDATGSVPGLGTFEGVEGLEAELVRRPDLFVATLAEKLTIFALGRGLEPSDGPAIRKVVCEAKAHDWRFSSIVEGIVVSTPFRMRRCR